MAIMDVQEEGGRIQGKMQGCKDDAKTRVSQSVIIIISSELKKPQNRMLDVDS